MADDPRPPSSGIRLDDGTWEDLGPDGRWRPAPGERVRAAVILGTAALFLLVSVVIASIDRGGDRAVAADDVEEATTTEATTTTSAPPDPASVGGEAPSVRCADDDRGARPLREREDVTVLVLNGAPKTGHAGANTDRLERLGYATMPPDNAERRPTSAAYHREGFCAEAEEVASQLGLDGAEIGPVPRNLPVVVGRANVVVVLGRDSI